MIVYLQKVYAGEYPQQQYPQQPEKKESHWVRNGLLATGALVGTHFGAKAGLLGRHMQKFAGNNQAWVGNKLGIYDIAKSGEKAATEAVAKMNAGVKGRGMDKAAWNEAFQKAQSEGKTNAKNMGQFKQNAINEAFKSDQVTKVNAGLEKENLIRDMMGNTKAGANFNIKEGMDYKAAEEAFNTSPNGKAYNTKHGFDVQPTSPPPAQ